MMYPFLQLDVQTEIVHSDMLSDGSVKVYIEKPVDGGFHSAACCLPRYESSSAACWFKIRKIPFFSPVLSCTHCNHSTSIIISLPHSCFFFNEITPR